MHPWYFIQIVLSVDVSKQVFRQNHFWICQKIAFELFPSKSHDLENQIFCCCFLSLSVCISWLAAFTMLFCIRCNHRNLYSLSIQWFGMWNAKKTNRDIYYSVVTNIFFMAIFSYHDRQICVHCIYPVCVSLKFWDKHAYMSNGICFDGMKENILILNHINAFFTFRLS